MNAGKSLFQERRSLSIGTVVSVLAASCMASAIIGAFVLDHDAMLLVAMAFGGLGGFYLGRPKKPEPKPEPVKELKA